LISTLVGLVVVAVTGWLLYRQVNPPAPVVEKPTLLTVVDRGISEEDLAIQRQKIADLEAQIAEKNAAGERDINLILQLGNLYYGIGELEKSVEQYNDILSTHPNDAPSLENRGQALLEMGDYVGALESWQQALAVNPYEVTYLRVADLITEHFPESQDQVRIVLENAITNLGQTAGLLKRLGEWYEANEMYDEAISHYKVALQLDPDDEWLKNQIDIVKQKKAESP